MMKIKLMGDYRGVCTDELYYMAGIYTVPGEMSEGHAGALLAAGRAVEEVEEVEEVEPVKAAPKKRRASPKKAPAAKRTTRAKK